jgi:choline dehydrogenase-like flavoprotein
MYINTEAAKTNTYDAIVIGSGVSGGFAAKELTQKGLRVLMVERGKMLEHVSGYENAMKDPWDSMYNGRLTIQQRESHPKLARDYPYNENTEKYWMNDSDALYKEEKRFDWFRPDIVGGKSIMWGRQSYRLSDIDFTANAKEGIAVDWPIRYADIAPWYSYVERFVGISGEKLNLPQLPDSDFLPPMNLNCVETHVKDAMAQKLGGRIMTIGRVANLSVAQKAQIGVGRSACQYRNKCALGCPYGAYFSTQSATLPAAMKTGRLTLRPNSLVQEILYDPIKQKAKGIRVIDKDSMKTEEFYAKILFVCGSTIGSTSLLLNSISARFPNGMGNDSGELGHNLMDHHFKIGASGDWEGGAEQYYEGRRANGIYVPRYRNIGSDKRDYLRGFGYQGRGARKDWTRHNNDLTFGADMKNELTKPGEWTMGFSGFGETLPYHENRVYLHPTEKDKWGLPLQVFDAEFKENERKMRIDMVNDAMEMLEAAGLKNIKPNNGVSYPGMAIHEMGTARMGRDAKTSVLNKWNQIHAVKNVFVTDGSAMTSASCVNPSLTYMALTARAANYAVAQLKKQNL